jgi:triacylglycerol esterase/lipase EstA (alpha/beta hydrolase family)
MAATEHVFLVPGFFGFANLGELTYFGHVHEFLRSILASAKVKSTVEVVKPKPTASLRKRAARVLETIASSAGADDGPIHLIGHSSGGLDIRLLMTPGVSLGGGIEPAAFVSRVRSVVTVSTPHYGTPIASFFTGLLGQRLLALLSLSTMYVLRFGSLPLAVVLKLGATFARLDRQIGLHSALLDQLFSQLLEDFSADRRKAIQDLLDEVRRDQALLPQLAPEAMDLFNATVHDAPGVRYGCVVSRAHPPGLQTEIAAGLDPAAHATHTIYRALYRLAAGSPRSPMPDLTPAQALVLRRAYGRMPRPTANDGFVPTASQVWGEVIHAAQADHLDVIGHFGDATRIPQHFDWLATGTGFDRVRFELLWTAVARYLGWFDG